MNRPDPAGGGPDQPGGGPDQPGSGPEYPPGMGSSDPLVPPPAAEPPSQPPPDWSTPETPTTAPPFGAPRGPYAAGPPHPGYPPPPGGGPPPGYPPPPRGAPPPGPVDPGTENWFTRNSHLALILGVIAALLLCCCVGAAVTLLTWGRHFYGNVMESRRHTVGLNEPVRDGAFEFRVTQIRCGVGQVGQLVSQPAVGQFCLVAPAVRNVGDHPASFSDTLQTAYGPSGASFTRAAARVSWPTPISSFSATRSTRATG